MQFEQLDSGLVVPVEKPAEPTFPTPWEAVPHDDLSASIRYRLQNTHVCECEAYERLGRDADGVILYRRFSMDVKWDGCCNVDFNTSEAMAHFCSFDDVRQFCALLETSYCHAARLLGKAGTWDGARLPTRWLPFGAEAEVRRHMHEAMTWITGKQPKGRESIVWDCVFNAKEAMRKAGVEVETLS